ncbi:metal ABC transporter substrate-binding protein [Candidatus Galacturonibacter soehngenii]|uniref:Zinc ABC transporter substrate-binding protein n=1 Tax=Candidatus Galacturonatibacter soehngenii TaxID=2307010 RepID=A0A7V7UHD6_9FIRM|nr:metal ABC transporter substrate-binding protein [Candidatus Galacturonibacter soehngenii]KAB1439873.1 zinc ABC transporter substrate-binding protein [Candidatus Galacturonibacter soehngenii]MBA4685890.1 zinc ABC transporter substrate-binding protein [Candidatus Galacturonibacter soehngenii]
MKNKIKVIMLTVLLVTVLVSCTKNSPANTTVEGENEKLTVVTTLFPYYDFVRQIAGDKVNNMMLLSPGMDAHSFEPTPANMIDVQKADVFIYNGGEMENWVEQILKATENKNQVSLRMMDYVKTVVEEEKEGMETEEEEEEGLEEPEYDEHIWTSPVNAQKLVETICETLMQADEKNASYYEANAKKYLEELKELDASFQGVVNQATKKIMIVGDKFPLRYLVDEYGLDYRAAFSGCTTQTEPSADTIAYLINITKEEQVNAVFHMELSNGKIADTISEATGAKVLTFHSTHNVTKEDFEKGVTYLELMRQNVKVLQEGLNE